MRRDVDLMDNAQNDIHCIVGIEIIFDFPVWQLDVEGVYGREYHLEILGDLLFAQWLRLTQRR